MPVHVQLQESGHCHERAWLVDRHRSLAQIRLPALTALITHPTHGATLFDTGYGRPLADSTSTQARLYRQILPFELPTESLPPADRIFLSHFHPDHIGGLRDANRVPILHSQQALTALLSASAYHQARAAFLPELLPADFARRAQPLEALPEVETGAPPFHLGRDLFGDRSVLAIPLPGHALGQHGLLCQLHDGRRLFLVADSAWLLSNITQNSPPSWPVQHLLGDRLPFLETLAQLHELNRRQPDLILIPSHCEHSIRSFSRAQ